MITLQDIILFEQLADKSFLSFNGQAEDLCALMYVHDHNNRRNYTYDFYCNKFMLPKVQQGELPKELRRFIAMVNAEMDYVNQFSAHKEDEEATTTEPAKLTPIIQTLMFQGGIEPAWLMMQGLDMLPFLSCGYERMMHEQAETNRFWNLLQISPHVKKSDYSRLQHQLKFAWEKEQQQPQISESLNNKIARFIFGKSKQ